MFYQTSVYFYFMNKKLFRCCIFDFYSVILHVLTLFFNDHQNEYWLTKRVKGVRPLHTNSGYKMIVKFIIIFGKNRILSNIKINRWSMLLEFACIFKCFEVKT